LNKFPTLNSAKIHRFAAAELSRSEAQKMSKVKRVEKQIWDVEGFAVCFVYADGRDVRGDRSDLPVYPFRNAAKDEMTVAEWRETRFKKAFPGFDIAVLDGSNEIVHGGMKLSTVRKSYDE
jgi:hypothetical protein